MAEGLRHRPTRPGVGGIALMENCETRGEFEIREIRIEQPELTGRQKSLVNHGPRRERAKISAGLAFRFDALPEKEKQTFEISAGLLHAEKALANGRLSGKRT